MAVYCSISNIHISYDDPCLIFILKPNKWYKDKYHLATLPIKGVYDDYYRLMSIEASENIEIIESYFQCDIYEFLEKVQRNQSLEIGSSENTGELNDLKMMYVKQDVYDYLSSEVINPYSEDSEHLREVMLSELFGCSSSEFYLLNWAYQCPDQVEKSNKESDEKGWNHKYATKEEWLSEFGISTIYLKDLNSFKDIFTELRILQINMREFSKVWTPHIFNITPQFNSNKVHKKILKEFGRIMTKSLKG